jgi:IMP dehydrogenase
MMAKRIIIEPSRTLMEFRLLPGLTTPQTVAEKISLRTPLVYAGAGQQEVFLNLPLVSAAMQSVSGPEMAIELATLGGAAFVFCSQPVAEQADMVRKIKRYKAGFVTPTTVGPDTTVRELAALRDRFGYSTFPVVDGESRLLGVIRRNDFDEFRHADLPVRDRMIPYDRLEVGVEISDLAEAHRLLVESHQAVLPIVDRDRKLRHLVFRKDIRNHLDNPLQVVDEHHRLIAVAAVNTHDYQSRVPALVEAEVDVLAIDSSDGHSTFQRDALIWLKENYPDLPVIGGNVITEVGFRYLVEAGARAVKVGMGGGSICITQEQKGTGRGLATTIMRVAEERDRYFAETGRYIPLIADGGIVSAKDVVISLALGADCAMMGRYFARMEEAPTDKVMINNRLMKPYWGEGSSRARYWKEIRYNQSQFVEGVEGFVEYAGKLRDNLGETVAKIRSSMSSCGVADIPALHQRAELEIVSGLSIREGKVHDIYMPGNESNYNDTWGS